jgi:hypothetical protein
MTGFILSGVTSDFVTYHDSVILDPSKKYEAALSPLDTYSSTPNIFINKTIFLQIPPMMVLLGRLSH